MISKSIILFLYNNRNHKQIQVIKVFYMIVNIMKPVLIARLKIITKMITILDITLKLVILL